MSALDTWSRDWSRHLTELEPARAEALLRQAEAAVSKLQTVANDPVRRAFHPASPYATTTARLRIAEDLPPPLRVGFLVPGAQYRAIARYSSAASRMSGQSAADQRGIALRVVEEGKVQDLLFTSGSEAHHARDAKAMVVSLEAAAASLGAFGKLAGVWTLVRGLGIQDGMRLVKTVGALAESGHSLARIPFFSRSPYELGPYAVKHRLVPIGDAPPALTGGGGTHPLTADLVERRRSGDVRYRWEAHGFVSPEATSLDDHREAWESPFVTLGELVLPRQESASEALSLDVAAELDKLSFSPFVRWDEHTLRPLGQLNFLRAAYRASVAGSGRHEGRDAPLHPREA